MKLKSSRTWYHGMQQAGSDQTENLVHLLGLCYTFSVLGDDLEHLIMMSCMSLLATGLQASLQSAEYLSVLVIVLSLHCVFNMNISCSKACEILFTFTKLFLYRHAWVETEWYTVETDRAVCPVPCSRRFVAIHCHCICGQKLVVLMCSGVWNSVVTEGILHSKNYS